MWETALSSAKLFVTGKLFRDNKVVAQKLAIGVALGVVATVVIGLIAPHWVGAIVGGAVAGFAQPILFKDLKYS